MNDDNPYRQPTAEVLAGGSLSELQVHEPVRRPASHGYGWLADAWALFRRRPLAWFGAASLLWAVVMGVNLVFMFIPFVGSIVPTVLSPLFGVGLLQLAHTMDRGEGLEIGDIFAGFRQRTGALLGLGGLLLLVMLVFVVLLMVGLFVIFGGDTLGQLEAAQQPGAAALSGMVAGQLIPVAVFLVFFLLLVFTFAGAVWFAPALVFFGDVHPVRALLQSLSATLRNVSAMTVYGLALIGFWILMLIPPVLVMMVPALLADGFATSPEAFLGAAGIWAVAGIIAFVLAYLVVMVVAVISIYTAFRDIFIAPRRLPS